MNYTRTTFSTSSLLWLVALTFAFLLLHVRPVNVQSVYVTDTHGNVVYDNGTVSFVRPVPIGTTGYKTNNEYDDSGLGVLFAFARSFINTVQSAPFPFDILKRMMNGEFNFTDDYMEVVNYAMGFTVCFAIGMLFVVLFAICGCCFCCCRCCCGCCGGDGVQVFDPNEGCKRMGYGQMLFMMSACMFVAACCVYVTNGQFTSALNFANTTTSDNLDDVQTYLANTADEFTYLVTDMYNLVHSAIMLDINQLGTVIEEAIESLLSFDDIFTAVNELDASVTSISTSLAQVRADMTSLQTAVSDLSSTLNTLANDVDSTSSGCASDCSPNLCSSIDTTVLRSATIDISSLPNLDSMQTDIDNVASANLSGIASSAQTALDGISSTIDSATSSVRTAVNSTMSSYQVMISGMTSGVLSTMQTAFPIADTKTTIGTYFEQAQSYDKYRQIMGLALTSCFLGLVGLFVLGMAMGVLCDDKRLLPTERGFCSNCGGCCIVLAVMLMFVVGPPMMLLTTISFLIGGLLEKTCQPMIDLTLWSDFVDTGVIPGFSLGSMLLGDPTVTLRVYDILLGCRANKAPFTVLKLNTLIPLEDYMNTTKYLSGLSSDLSSVNTVDLTPYQVLTPALQSALTDLQNAGLSSINFTQIYQALNQPVTSFNIGTYISTMTTLISACVNPTQADWITHKSTMETIRDVKAPAVDTAITTLKASLAVLESDIAGVDTKTSNVLSLAAEADNQIQNNLTAVLDEGAAAFMSKLITYVDQYAAEANYLVYNEIGNCLPLWNLYNSFVVMLCNYGVDSLNGFWFSLGWGLFFFIPVVIVGVNLAGYYSTMDSIKNWPEPEEEHDDEDFDDFQAKLDMLKERDNEVNADYMD